MYGAKFIEVVTLMPQLLFSEFSKGDNDFDHSWKFKIATWSPKKYNRVANIPPAFDIHTQHHKTKAES